MKTENEKHFQKKLSKSINKILNKKTNLGFKYRRILNYYI